MSCAPIQYWLRTEGISTRGSLDPFWQHEKKGMTHQEKPRQCAAKQHLQVPPFPIMCNKVGPRCLGNVELRLCRLLGPRPRKLVNIPLAPFPLTVCADILHRLLDVAFDVKGISRRFGNCQAKVECEAPRNCSKPARTGFVSNRMYSYPTVSSKNSASPRSEPCWDLFNDGSHTQRLFATSYRQHWRMPHLWSSR